MEKFNECLFTHNKKHSDLTIHDNYFLTRNKLFSTQYKWLLRLSLMNYTRFQRDKLRPSKHNILHF